ncbi:MAG: hypothetical protein JXJ19_01640 [Elusimicrobia bacterium]|nr:hypothetical protein [Elusimicrobiota bacterium]
MSWRNIISTVLFLSVFSGAAAANSIVIDDFDEGEASVNKLGKNAGAWASNQDGKTKGCYLSLDGKEKAGALGRSLCVRYNIITEETYYLPGYTRADEKNRKERTNVCVYSTKLEINLSGYQFLIISIKGDEKEGYTRSLPVELRDGSNNTARYIIDGIGPRWKEFIVPLGAFSRIENWNYMTELLFVFDDSITRKKGTLYIDNITFATSDKAASAPGLRAQFQGTGIVVDGDVDDWSGIMETDPQRLTANNNMEYGRINNEKDSSAYFYSCWDTDKLYFAVFVIDNELMISGGEGGIDRSDGITVYIDSDNNGFTWNSSGDIEAVITVDGKMKVFPERLKNLGDKIEYAVKRRSNGYIVEMALVWDATRSSPEKERIINASVAVQDEDYRDGSRRAKLNWYYQPFSGKIELGKIVLG